MDSWLTLDQITNVQHVFVACARSISESSIIGFRFTALIRSITLSPSQPFPCQPAFYTFALAEWKNQWPVSEDVCPVSAVIEHIVLNVMRSFYEYTDLELTRMSDYLCVSYIRWEDEGVLLMPVTIMLRRSNNFIFAFFRREKNLLTRCSPCRSILWGSSLSTLSHFSVRQTSDVKRTMASCTFLGIASMMTCCCYILIADRFMKYNYVITFVM